MVWTGDIRVPRPALYRHSGRTSLSARLRLLRGQICYMARE
jgi:hypothetical protein